jgi:hypothetical protein
MCLAIRAGCFLESIFPVKGPAAALTLLYPEIDDATEQGKHM